MRRDPLDSDGGTVEHRFQDFLRVWPGSKQSTQPFAFFAVGRARPWAKGEAGLYRLSKDGKEYELLADLSALRANIGLDTTGQPLLYRDEVFIPMWSSKFYTEGYLGLAIVSCNLKSSEPDIRYFDPQCSYGSHFFNNINRPDELFLGVGNAGGGRQGKIRFTPDRGILLKSDDAGKTWHPVFASQEASALYDGLAIDDLVIVTSRDSHAIHVLKEQPDGTYCIRKTYLLESPARNISLLTWENPSTIVVSSDNGFYMGSLDGESLEIKRIRMPVMGFALRYPTIIGNRFLSFIGISSTLGRSSLLLYGAKSDQYYVDLTRLTGLRTFSRMALSEGKEGESEQLLLGTEMEGRLRIYDTKWLARLRRKLGTRMWFETTAKSIWSSGTLRARDMLGRYR